MLALSVKCCFNVLCVLGEMAPITYEAWVLLGPKWLHFLDHLVSIFWLMVGPWSLLNDKYILELLSVIKQVDETVVELCEEGDHLNGCKIP